MKLLAFVVPNQLKIAFEGDRFRRLWWCSGIALLVIALASCADGESDRRFANDPLPTEDILAQPTPPPVTRIVLATESPSTPVAPQALFAHTGTAARTFAAVERAIMQVPVDGSNPSEVVDLDGVTLITYAGSLNGERLAVLTSDHNTVTLRLRILDASGSQIADVDIGQGSGTPVPAGPGQYRIAWSPAGDELFLSLGTGGVLEISESGSVRSLLSPENAPSPRAIAWSPDGSAIAWVDAGTEGAATGLYVASVDALPLDPVTVIRPIPGRSRQIVEIAWGAGASGILYAERAPGGDLSIGGDLFAISPSGGSPWLLATAGGVSQVGAIGSFAISPDGSAVAYSVIAPAGKGTVVKSLILRQIDGPTSVNVATESGASIENLTWSSQGLTWAVRPAESPDTHVVVQLAGADGSVRTLYTVRDEATPIASPISAATPVSTPVATATPKP